MKRLKAFSIIVFILAAAGFGYYQFGQMKNVDKLGPLITIDNKIIEVSTKDDESVLISGVTAQDTKDGDVTDSVVIEGLSTFLEEGRRLVTYAAFDSDLHVSKATREIIYTDYTSPKFELEQPLRFPIGTTNFTVNMRVKDCLDGDITRKIKLSPDSAVTVDTAGEYKAIFQVSNSAGDVSYLPVTIEIYEGLDRDTPQIELSEYLVYTDGKKLDLESYLENVLINGVEYNLTKGKETYGKENNDANEEAQSISYNRIRINDTIDYKKDGTYEVTYSIIGEDGNRGSVRLIVVVDRSSGQEEKDAGK